jgi:cytoskeletal protein CcmA (bactofilin family)
MAGQGYKVWSAGDVLAAADVNGYLMEQSVMVFASSAARSSAIGTATEGMVSYLRDTNALEFFDSTSWRTVGVDSTVAGSVIAFGSTAVSAAYTAVAGLDNASIIVTGTAAVTVTVPDVLSVGDSLNIIRDTSGTVTIAAGTGVTSWAGAGTAGTAVTFKIDQQFNGAQVIKTAANTYRVIGKITV